MPPAFLTGVSPGVLRGRRDQWPSAASRPAADGRLVRPGAASALALLSRPDTASGADTVARMQHMVRDYARQPRAAVRHAAAGAFVSSFSPRLPAGASRQTATVRLAAGPSGDGEGKKGGLWFILDINTKGGIVFYSILGIALPFVADAYLTGPMEVEVSTAHNLILGLYIGVGTLGWTGSYFFRVANKDMTYAQQLKDYEAAVIEKRFEELSEVEVDVLLDQLESTGPASGPTLQPPSSASAPTARWKPDYGDGAPPQSPEAKVPPAEKEGLSTEPGSGPTIQPASNASEPKARWKPDYGEDVPPQNPEATAPPAEKEGLTLEDFFIGSKGRR